MAGEGEGGREAVLVRADPGAPIAAEAWVTEGAGVRSVAPVEQGVPTVVLEGGVEGKAGDVLVAEVVVGEGHRMVGVGAGTGDEAEAGTSSEGSPFRSAVYLHVCRQPLPLQGVCRRISKSHRFPFRKEFNNEGFDSRK